MFLLTTQADKPEAILLNAQRDKRSDHALGAKTGIPRCMTIAIDRSTGIVVTGATRAIYSSSFPWLEKISKKIHRLRVGQRFQKAVDICSDNVTQLIADSNELLKQKFRTSDETPPPQKQDLRQLDDRVIQEIYSTYMSATRKTSELARQPRPKTSVQDPVRPLSKKWYARMLPQNHSKGYDILHGPKDTIFSFAIDMETLTMKRPCLRCQRMYSHWYLWDSLQGTAADRVAFDDLFAKDALSYNVKNDTCSYCAETVAAAKIYLLRKGKLALVG